MRPTTPQERRSRPMPDIFKNVEDVLAKSLDKGKASSDGQKRKLLEAIDNVTPSKRRTSTGSGNEDNTPTPAKKQYHIPLPTPTRPFRPVGLPRTPRRPAP
jgi:hypothetical protein